MKSAAIIVMEDFPPEIYPLFIPEPAAAAAMRCVCTTLHTKIPRDLFKNTAFTELLMRWESPRYYAEIAITVEPKQYLVTIADGILGCPTGAPGDSTLVIFGGKYVLNLFKRFTAYAAIGWWGYVDELRPYIYKLHTLGAGGKLKAAEFLENLPVVDDRTGAVWFAEPVEWRNVDVGLFVGKFTDLAPLIGSECVTALYKHIDFTVPAVVTCDGGTV